jgi:nitrite reductase (NO-forming)
VSLTVVSSVVPVLDQRRLASSTGLARWLKTPDKMLETDAEAQALLKEWKNIPIPNQNLSDEEIANYLKFFHWADEQPAGTVKPMAGH